MKHLLLAAALGVAAAALWAEDAETDIFAEGAFDSAVSQGKTAAEASKLSWLGGVSLASTTNLVLPTERTAYGSSSLFAGKGFVKASNPSVGALFLSYTYNHTLWAATNDGPLTAGYALGNPDPSKPVYSLSEFHLSFDFGKVLFVRLGNQLLDWGASAVWSPADFLNRRTPDPNSSLDTRAGKPGLRLHVPYQGGNLFVFADASRSLTSGGNPRDLIQTGALAFRADKVLAGWNVGLIGNFGKASDPRVGLTAVGALLGIDLWGEVGSVLPLGGHSFSYAASAGLERSFGEDSEWTLRGEGFWNPEGQGATDIGFSNLTSFNAQRFYWGQVYGYAELVKKKFLLSDVTGSLSVTANVSDHSWQAVASLRSAFPSVVPLTLYAQFNGGPQAREFTVATSGPAWTLGLRSVVDF